MLNQCINYLSYILCELTFQYAWKQIYVFQYLLLQYYFVYELYEYCPVCIYTKQNLFFSKYSKVLNGIIKTPTNEKEVDETKKNIRFEGKDEVDGSPRQSPRPQPIQTRNIVVEEERPRSPKRVHPNSWVGPPSPKSPRHISCMRPDISGLVRRVRNVRIVGYAPETCVWTIMTSGV